MAFEALDRLESQTTRVMMYPSDWTFDVNSTEIISRLLLKAEP